MKTKSFKIVTLMAVLLLTLPALAAEKMVSQVFKTPAFHSISTSSGWDVVLTQGNEFAVRAEAIQKHLDNLSIEVKSNTLYVNNKQQIKFSFNFFSRNNTRKRIYITLPELKSVSASGGSDVSATAPFKVDNITFSLSGGSDLKNFTLQCNEFNCRQSGGSDSEVSFVGVNKITVMASGGSDVALKNISAKSVSVGLSGGSDGLFTGATDYFLVSASGGSDVDAVKLAAQTCKAGFSGGSDGTLNVEKELKVSVSGGSDVRYKGNAALQKNSDKSSDVKRI